ncbi:uncharacterized protein LOC107364492 isoform X1 [Tetranychus urticae]|uniref:uncharacterized protein LOC107364492 isoform X1 n=1 Tax=Tetranychus urticae TaxID=32264 RepID=UPI00077C0C96|nr:uncharacterized protein LOC107364492 isoform X1 [Tetranychus urticae]
MSTTSLDLTSNLTNEEKTGYDEIIEKLFPKCRPRSDGSNASSNGGKRTSTHEKDDLRGNGNHYSYQSSNHHHSQNLQPHHQHHQLHPSRRRRSTGGNDEDTGQDLLTVDDPEPLVHIECDSYSDRCPPPPHRVSSATSLPILYNSSQQPQSSLTFNKSTIGYCTGQLTAIPGTCKRQQTSEEPQNLSISNKIASNNNCNSLNSNASSSDQDSPEEDQIIIGNVPIAKYTGSPRRYGPKLPLVTEQADEKETDDISSPSKKLLHPSPLLSARLIGPNKNDCFSTGNSNLYNNLARANESYENDSFPPHHFSLSPEITDGDSNDIESEFSIGEGSLHSLSRSNMMPILEDGLSSGIPSSDNELDDDFDETSLPNETIPTTSTITAAVTSSLAPTTTATNLPVSTTTQSANHSNQVVKREKESLLGIKETLIDCIQERVAYEEIHNCQSSNNLPLEKQIQHGYPTYHPTTDNSHPERLKEPIDMYDKSMEVRQPMEQHRQNFRRTRSLQLDQSNGQNFGSTVNSSVSESNFEARYEQDHGSSRKISNLNQPKSSFESKENSKMNEHSTHSHLDEESDTDQETDRLLGAQRIEEKNNFDEKNNGYIRKKNSPRETLIEGVLFRARYLGSTQLICNGQPTKATRMMQAEEAVSRIKSLAPDGESQPSTEVDLFISTEKIMVLNTDLKEIMMDHALRTISYIADIGDLLVLMTRRRVVNPSEDSNDHKMKRIPRMICHVFESEEAQFIAQSIGQAFQVAYMEFLKANGIEDSSFVKEMDYQEVLNSQEIFGNELEMFAKKDRQKEIIIPKQKGEILGIVIVESGWGSMLPTVVIANMTPQGPAARCGQINIGDQIIAINGISLVGLPLSTCQSYIKNTKNQTAVKMTLVPCAPVVEVKIKRPDTKYQLGFSVQNGVICSLLRGGIAERGGVRVGHRIIEINGQSVVAVPHERIVNLLATSVGEIAMKTMPTSMYRLLTGQESPAYI